MKRQQRTRILVLGSPDLKKDLAAEITEKYSVSELESPRVGLLMTTVRESARKTLFHLGEVLIAEARVRVDETAGLGLLAGTDLDAARQLAVIDAAFNAGLPETAAWISRLEAEEMRLESALVQEQILLGMTRVSFETMDRESAP